MSLSSITTHAAIDFTVDGLKFSITDNGAKTVKLAEMYYYAPEVGSVVIPSKVTNAADGIQYVVTGIGKTCFEWSEITAVTIPNTVLRIDSFAFRACQKLKTVTFEPGNKMTRLYRSAFEYCNALETIALPDDITIIEDWAFLECKSLTSITLPSKLNTVMSFAFRDCPLLEEVICPAVFPPTLSDGVFYNTFISDVILVVPKGSKTKYELVSPWNTFLEIQERVFTSAVSSIQNEKNILISLSGNSLSITGLSGYNSVSIFNITGKMLYNQYITDIIEGIELPTKGIYIIKVDNFVRKIRL